MSRFAHYRYLMCNVLGGPFGDRLFGVSGFALVLGDWYASGSA